jgi:hypothetical protein
MSQQGSIEVILRREVCEEFTVASNFGWNCEVLALEFFVDNKSAEVDRVWVRLLLLALHF